MKFIRSFSVLAVAGLAVCAFAPKSSAQATSAAESACMAAVNSQYGGQESELYVVSSEYSEAGSLVMVQADGDLWRCLSSNGGEVEELSLESSAPSYSQQGTSAAESACMAAVNSQYGGSESSLYSSEGDY